MLIETECTVINILEVAIIYHIFTFQDLKNKGMTKQQD